MQANRPSFLYIVSWEICNRVGGVHTVLETSAAHLQKFYGEDLLYVGPDLWADRAGQKTFLEDAMQPELAALAAEQDVPVRFGRWAVRGSPPCALIHFSRLLERKNEILGDLWNDYQVDSIAADWDTVERMLFGYAAGKFLELHYHAAVRPRARRAVAHFHQWDTASGLLYAHSQAPEIATVYTPHGTVLGRALADSGEPLLGSPGELDPVEAARDCNVQAEFTVERAAVRRCDVLTSVGEQVSEEAAHLLGRRPDLITPNGFASSFTQGPQHRDEIRAAVFRVAERFTGSPLDMSTTRLAVLSGRYEFHNKGIDVALKALGRLCTRDQPLPRKLLFLIVVPAAQTGPRPEVVHRLKASALAGAACGVCTHNLAHSGGDDILEACAAAGLDNRPGCPVIVVFCPVLLDRRDPLFPYDYTDVLHASDISVFPSLYEPWGYTPLESLAAGVPTVTTDLTGFGRFVAGLPEEERRAVTLLPGVAARDNHLDAVLADELAAFLERSDEELDVLRRSGGGVVERTSWDHLIQKTRAAHELALQKAAGRTAHGPRPSMGRLTRRSIVSLPARSELEPQIYRFTVAAAIPERLARIEELARNLWWTWNPRARRLFARLDGEGLKAADGNPVRLVSSLGQDTWSRAASDKSFVADYDAVLREFDAYRARPSMDAPSVAYFCAEFALHESLPIFSGGLGVLAGDHLKSASDLALPFTAIGLRYQHGYFRQRIEKDGTQGIALDRMDPAETPLVEVTDSEGNPLRISVSMPEREVKAAVWKTSVGRVPLFLLDTLIAENDPQDHGITDRLYPSDREPRIQQEVLLGMGGWRVLKALGRTPEVCHLNEGHSAFLLLDRLIDLVEGEGLTFEEAKEVVRAGTAFTTHTPVPAGHDRFSDDLMRRYFGRTAQRLGLDWEEFLDLGRTTADRHEFSMTNLALHLAGRSNGVSKLHGEVARRMHGDVWPGFHAAEAPVESVTNGVHLPTWIGPEMEALLEKELGVDWADSGDAVWDGADEFDDGALWQAHQEQKHRFLGFLKESCQATGVHRGESSAALRRRLEGIREDALWIGYARRFAPYKRAGLLFRDEERLLRLLDDEKRPVRIVFAGKSHPDDGEGGELIRRIVEYTTDERFQGKVFFVEDYGLRAGRMLVQGVDVWLNTPMRPLEASGTSGMKACANGAPHLSILDGWWCEAYDGTNGWAIGDGDEADNPDIQNERDALSLYRLLETELVPMFFERKGGRPEKWLERMKRTLRTVPRFFNTNRMVTDYVEESYRPLAKLHEQRTRNEYVAARELVVRHRRIEEAWEDVRIEEISVTDLSRHSIALGEAFEIRAVVQLGRLAPEEVTVELYAGPAGPTGELTDPVVIPLILNEKKDDGAAEYSGAYLPKTPGNYRYGVRVLPAVGTREESYSLGLVRWA